MMADTRRNRFSFDRKHYEDRRKEVVEGSVARSVDTGYEFEEDYYDDQNLFDEEYTENDFEPMPAVKRREREAYRRRPVSLREIKTKKVYNFSFAQIAVMGVLLIVVAAFCYIYIQARADIIQMNKKITSAKEELKDIQNKNASLESQLDVETDRNYIYTVAVTKLNMIYPKENDTVYYNRPYEGYVRQYYEIPAVR